MNREHAHQDRDGQLWDRFIHDRAGGDSVPIETVDPNTLAAYIDGNLDARSIDRVEHAMAQDPRLLETVIALRNLELERADGRGVARQASVGVAAESSVDRLSIRDGSRSVLASPWRSWSGWAAAAVVVLAVGVAGHVAGQQTRRYEVMSASAMVAAADRLVGLDQQDQPFLLMAVAGGGVR